MEFHGDFWHQKTRVPVLSYGVVYVILRLVFLVQCRLVTDGQTDGQTRRQHIYRASIALRGKNEPKAGNMPGFITEKQTEKIAS